LDKLTPEALRDAVGRLLDPVLRKRMSKSARARMPVNGAQLAARQILEVGLPRVFPATEFDNLEPRQNDV
jgi:hypothetical protein